MFGSVSLPWQRTVVVLGTSSADTITLFGDANPGDVRINLNGWVPELTSNPQGLGRTPRPRQFRHLHINFGSTLVTPINTRQRAEELGERRYGLVVNGDNGPTNAIDKTTGQITWGSPVTETVFRSGIPNTTINATWHVPKLYPMIRAAML